MFRFQASDELSFLLRFWCRNGWALLLMRNVEWSRVVRFTRSLSRFVFGSSLEDAGMYDENRPSECDTRSPSAMMSSTKILGHFPR